MTNVVVVRRDACKDDCVFVTKCRVCEKNYCHPEVRRYAIGSIDIITAIIIIHVSSSHFQNGIVGPAELQVGCGSRMVQKSTVEHWCWDSGDTHTIANGSKRHGLASRVKTPWISINDCVWRHGQLLPAASAEATFLCHWQHLSCMHVACVCPSANNDHWLQC